MHLKDNIKNFIYDQDYYISFYEEYIHLFNYKNINKIDDKNIEVSFDSFLLIIHGNNFIIKKMLLNELLVKGITKDIKYIYEK